jgi:hypothetical protein
MVSVRAARVSVLAAEAVAVNGLAGKADAGQKKRRPHGLLFFYLMIAINTAQSPDMLS